MIAGSRVGASAMGWAGGIVAVTAFVAPLLSLYAPLGMAPLFTASALALLAADMIRSHGWPRAMVATIRAMRPLRHFALLCLLLLAWALASAAWAVDPAQALLGTGQVSGVACAALIHLAVVAELNGEARRIVTRALLAGVFIALVFFAVEILDDAWLGRQLHDLSDAGLDQVFSRYNRGLTVFLLLAFPALLALRRAAARLVLAPAVFAIVMVYYGSSLQFAAIAALAAAGLTLCLPRGAPWLIGGLLALFVAAAPLLPPLTLSKIDPLAITARTGNVSIAHRFIVWRFSAERIADKPLTGWGMNAARAIPGGKEKVALNSATPPVMGELLPLHTHNAPLQWWLELGLPGAALMAGLWLFALAMLARAAPARVPRAIALGGFAAAFAIANLSFGAWQAWWLATLGLAAALLALQTRTSGAADA